MKTTDIATGVADGGAIAKALGLEGQHTSRIEIVVDASSLIECKVTRYLDKSQAQSLAGALAGVQLKVAPRSRKIVPVDVNDHGTYVAPRRVLAVFDTNGTGQLLEVAYRVNPIDDIEFDLVCAPYGQIYAEIETIPN